MQNEETSYKELSIRFKEHFIDLYRTNEDKIWWLDEMYCTIDDDIETLNKMLDKEKELK